MINSLIHPDHLLYDHYVSYSVLETGDITANQTKSQSVQNLYPLETGKPCRAPLSTKVPTCPLPLLFVEKLKSQVLSSPVAKHSMLPMLGCLSSIPGQGTRSHAHN